MKAELVIAVIAGVASGYFIYSPSLKEVTDKYSNTAPSAQTPLQPKQTQSPEAQTTSQSEERS